MLRRTAGSVIALSRDGERKARRAPRPTPSSMLKVGVAQLFGRAFPREYCY